MNPLTGEKKIKINGADYILKFNWRALSEIEQKYGENPNLFNADVVAHVASIGLVERHPEMTADKILELSPPLMPFVKEIQTAIQWAYFGSEPMPKEDTKTEKKNRLAGGLWQRLKAPFKKESRR